MTHTMALSVADVKAIIGRAACLRNGLHVVMGLCCIRYVPPCPLCQAKGTAEPRFLTGRPCPKAYQHRDGTRPLESPRRAHLRSFVPSLGARIVFPHGTVHVPVPLDADLGEVERGSRGCATRLPYLDSAALERGWIRFPEIIGLSSPVIVASEQIRFVDVLALPLRNEYTKTG